MSTRWTDAESDDLDSEIKALRLAEKRARSAWSYRDTRPQATRPKEPPKRWRKQREE